MSESAKYHLLSIQYISVITLIVLVIYYYSAVDANLQHGAPGLMMHQVHMDNSGANVLSHKSKRKMRYNNTTTVVC